MYDNEFETKENKNLNHNITMDGNLLWTYDWHFLRHFEKN